MLKQSEVSNETKTANTKVFSVDELNQALFDFEDLMGRCLSPFFLLGDTAKDILDGFTLKGNKVEVGVETKYLTPEVLSTIKTYKGVDLDKNQGKWEYMFGEIPVEVKIISRKYKFFEFPNSVFYWGENYWTPNPFATYYKSRYLIK